LDLTLEQIANKNLNRTAFTVTFFAKNRKKLRQQRRPLGWRYTYMDIISRYD